MLLGNATLIILKLLQSCKCNETSEYKVLNQIITAAHAEKPIETLVYFGDEAAIARFIEPIMPGLPKIVALQNCRSYFKLHDHFNSQIFFLAFGELATSSKWNFLSQSLVDMQRHVRGIFVAPHMQNVNLRSHFQWCWQSGFMSILALVSTHFTNLTQPYRIFNYTRFPHLEVMESTLPASSNESFFTSRMHNFRRYRMRTALVYDPPRVFRVQVGFKHEPVDIIGGYTARMYRSFMKYHNGVMQLATTMKHSNSNIITVIRQLNSGEADLTMNTYFNFPGVRTSYPVMMTKWCILLPASGSIPAYEYFLRPFQLETWVCLSGLLIFLSFAVALNEFIVTKYLHPWAAVDLRYGRAFLETLRLMLFVSIPSASHRYFRPDYAVSYVLISILGFMMSNFYLAALTSFRTSFILKPQIDTMQQMVEQNITINTVSYEIPMVLNNRGLPKGFAELLKPRTFNELIAEVLTLSPNNTKAYLVRDDTLRFVLTQQQNFLYPRFRQAKECITTIPVGFLMPRHSQFKTVLDVFTMQVSASGLLERWFEDSIFDGLHTGLLNFSRAFKRAEEPLSLQHFQMAFLIIFLGSTLALVCFVFEQLQRVKVNTTIELKSKSERQKNDCKKSFLN